MTTNGALELLTGVFLAPESLAVVTRLSDSVIVGLSPGFATRFGIQPDEVIGRTALEAGLWRDAEHRASLLGLLQQQGSLTGEPVSIRARDGRQYDGLMTCALIEHEGKPYLFSLIQQVREYFTEAEARTREIESLRTLILESEVGVYRRRGLPHGLIDANPALARMLGSPSSQALLAACAGRAEFDYEDPAHAQRLDECLRADGRFSHVRAEVRRFDGGTVWVSESARAVFDAEGRLLHADGTMIDISGQVHAEQALAQSEALHRNLVENSRDAVFLMQHGRIMYANEALATILQCRNEDLIGASYFDWVAPEDIAAQAQRRQARESGSQETQDYEIRLLRRDGARRLCAVRAGAVQFRGELASIGTLRDITEERAQQSRLEAAEERYRLLFQHAVLGMYQSTLDGRLIEVNVAFACMFRYDSPAQMCADVDDIGAHYADPELRPRAMAALQREGQLVNWEVELARRDGSRFWALASMRLVRHHEGDGGHLEGSLIDISARRAAELELDYIAHHDSLTGLANRRSFERSLRAILDRLQAGVEGPHAVLLLDLDRFKLVNDSLGHAAGDELLVQFAAGLTREFGDDLWLARYGGDEFALLSRSRMDRAGVVNVARRVQELAAAPFQVRGHQVFTGASIGIVMIDDGDTPAEDILRDADTAMFRAKSHGAGHALFDRRMHAAASARLALETELRFALARGELRAHYQPIVELDSGRIVGIEALARWQHPTRGLLPPSQFLCVAEDSGMQSQIDLRMLEQALEHWLGWRRAQGELAPGRLSINISDRLFTSPEFPATLKQMLDQAGADPGRVHLEITESVFRSNHASLRDSLAALKAIGVRLVVDDFGTGYSSLVSFSEAAFDGLKIDQGFIRDLESNSRHRAIVRTIVQFARDLGLSLVAEGVETEGQAQLLREYGCELAQGYFYARPMPPEQCQFNQG
jgi:diguanylate cyclase (GGDEF)-like protein/PAS domain S-box-containing protein